LSHLEDAALHRRLGDRLAPLLAEIEQGPIHGFYSEVVPALRAVAPTGLILREHDYFGNMGIPPPLPPLEVAAWASSPHGYGLVVDPEAMPLASDTRSSTIFSRAAETAQRLGVPVIVGE